MTDNPKPNKITITLSDAPGEVPGELRVQAYVEFEHKPSLDSDQHSGAEEVAGVFLMLLADPDFVKSILGEESSTSGIRQAKPEGF